MIEKDIIIMAICPRIVENVFTTCNGIVCECKSIIVEKRECFLRIEMSESNDIIVFLEKHKLDGECDSSRVVTNYFTEKEIREFETMYHKYDA